MFNFHKVDGDTKHLIIESDEPVRIEVVANEEGHLVVYGYKGTDVKNDQEPDLVFDSAVNEA